MEIERDALLRIVRATRSCMKLVEAMEALLIDKNAWTVPDEIAGDLKDALFILSGEKLSEKESFDDSRTMKLLKSDMDDGTVADWFLMMDRLNKRIETVQPKPQTISKEELQQMHQQNNGGYTPEGEFV